MLLVSRFDRTTNNKQQVNKKRIEKIAHKIHRLENLNMEAGHGLLGVIKITLQNSVGWGIRCPIREPVSTRTHPYNLYPENVNQPINIFQQFAMILPVVVKGRQINHQGILLTSSAFATF
jgi:hypothetical protein